MRKTDAQVQMEKLERRISSLKLELQASESNRLRDNQYLLGRITELEKAANEAASVLVRANLNNSEDYVSAAHKACDILRACARRGDE